MRRNETKYVLLELLSMAFLAASGIFVRYSVISPINAGMWRCLFALPVLYLMCRSELPALTKKDWLMLLAAGVNLGRADRTGNTPLHVAAQINDPGRVLALLKAGAPANARNKQGQTFQRYLFMTREGLLSAEARTARRAVVTWLRQNGIPVEGE